MLYWQLSCNVFKNWLHEVKFTMYNVVPTLDSKLSLQYIMNFVTATSIWRWNRDFKFPLYSWYQYNNVAATLCQLCKKRQIWITYGCMITIWQTCLKISKKINNNIFPICDMKFRSLFSSHSPKNSPNCPQKIQNDDDSHSLKVLVRFSFSEYFQSYYFWKRWRSNSMIKNSSGLILDQIMCKLSTLG